MGGKGRKKGGRDKERRGSDRWQGKRGEKGRAKGEGKRSEIMREREKGRREIGGGGRSKRRPGDGE